MLILIVRGINFRALKTLILMKLIFAYHQPETKTDERYKMFLKDRNNNGNGLILYTNEGILGKLINSCDFKEGSEVKVFEFSMSNKKWLLLGNYKPSSKMNCLP